MNSASRALLVWAALGPVAIPCVAQELSPRSYWPAPQGTRLLFVGYSYSSGDVVTDPSIPIVGVDSKIHTGVLGYLQTLSLAGRTANVVLEVPYTGGKTVGTLEGKPANRDVSGLGDITATLSANLLGAPSMTPVEFSELRRSPRPILGASLKVVAPTGGYEKDKVINIGANRWALKGELGLGLPIRRKWILEFELGAWYFGDNHDFLGTTREQKPIIALECHLVRRFKPGFWGALDFNYYAGGRTTISGELEAVLQRNARLGATVAYALGGRHAIRAGYSTGVVAESGGDFDKFVLTYNIRI